MLPQFRDIAVGTLLFLFSITSVQAQSTTTVKSWVVSNLPSGVTIKSATPSQLATAVVAAIHAHPKQAKAIVAYVFSELTDTDRTKALALTDALILAVPEDQVAGLIKIALSSLSQTINPETGQSAQSALASVIMQRAIADDPSLTSAILAAIGAAPPWLTTQLVGPGGITNPANFSNTSGAVNSPQ